MLNWFVNLDMRGKMIFWGSIGVGVNVVLYFMGAYFPKMLIASAAILLVGALFVPREDSDTM